MPGLCKPYTIAASVGGDFQRINQAIAVNVATTPEQDRTESKLCGLENIRIPHQKDADDSPEVEILPPIPLQWRSREAILLMADHRIPEVGNAVGRLVAVCSRLTVITVRVELILLERAGNGRVLCDKDRNAKAGLVVELLLLLTLEEIVFENFVVWRR